MQIGMEKWSVGAIEYWVNASLHHFTTPIRAQKIL